MKMKMNTFCILLVMVVSFLLSSCANNGVTYSVAPVDSWLNPELQKPVVRKKTRWTNPDSRNRTQVRRKPSWEDLERAVNKKKAFCDRIMFKNKKVWCRECRDGVADNIYCGMNDYYYPPR